jgi:hypothetical protein
LTFPQRQLLVRRAMELGDQGLTPEDEVAVEKCLADHRRDAKSAVPLSVMEGYDNYEKIPDPRVNRRRPGSRVFAARQTLSLPSGPWVQ